MTLCGKDILSNIKSKVYTLDYENKLIVNIGYVTGDRATRTNPELSNALRFPLSWKAFHTIRAFKSWSR